MFPLGEVGNGDDPTDASDDQTVRERNETSRLTEAELKRWSFVSTDRRTELKIEPAMRWSYFDTGRYYGDLYVIKAEERPVAVFAIFRWFHPVVRAYACATSLADAKVVASRNGKILWQPRTSAVKWEPLPNADPPSRSRSNRLVQMRRIARRFWGEVSVNRLANQRTMKKLRLLSQPIYRYSTDDVDGAIFAFANGTTPAVLLCVEAEMGPNEIGWRYGFARRWSWESRMNNEHEEIWMAPSTVLPTNLNASYHVSVIPQENAD